MCATTLVRHSRTKRRQCHTILILSQLLSSLFWSSVLGPLSVGNCVCGKANRANLNSLLVHTGYFCARRQSFVSPPKTLPLLHCIQLTNKTSFMCKTDRIGQPIMCQRSHSMNSHLLIRRQHMRNRMVANNIGWKF
jgi:hypothetical protein